ncbi:MAG: SoxR reducing system RseC family protein [Clostridia bacterium]|nr:SoxR reducing system RseC family protein [Clostridia bacterium]
MTGEGVVLSTDGTYATVRVEKKSACSGECASCGLCQKPVFDVKARNKAGAETGDRVKLYLPSCKIYVAAMVVYMLPVLLILAVLGICSILGAPSFVAPIICGVMLVVWLMVIRVYNKKANLTSDIVEIVKENP